MMRLRLAAFAFTLLLPGWSAFAQTLDVRVSKTGPSVAVAGSNVTYNVVVTNAGPAGATGVSLADPIPEGMTFVSHTESGGTCAVPLAGFGGAITCSIPTLAANASATFAFTLNIPAATTPGTLFTNVATITAPGDNNGSNNSAQVDTLVATPDLAVTKSGPAQANAGANVTYTVTVTNVGQVTVTSGTLTDLIPAGMTFVSSTGGVCSTPEVDDGGTITCSLALAPAASTTFTFTLKIPDGTAPGTIFTNIATVAVGGNADINDENNTASATTSTPPPPQSDGAIAKSGPSAVGPGREVAWNITVRNVGPDAAASFEWQDTLPGTMTFVSATQTSGPAMSCTTPAVGAGGTITCTATSFPVTQATFVLTAAVPADTATGTVFTNTAIVTASNDSNEENNVSSVSTTISAVDLSVTKTGPATAPAGTQLTYTITLANTGPDAAFTVVLTDALPANTTFVSFTKLNGPPSACSAAGGFTCLFEVFGSGASSQFTLVLLAGGGSSVTNTASVTSDSFDTAPANNSSTVVTTITPRADLAVVKSGPATITAGNNITYTLSMTNNGPSAATTVTLTDVLPAGTTFVSLTNSSGTPLACTTPAVGANGTVTCTIGTFPAGATSTYTLVARVLPNATGSIQNTITKASATTDVVPANDTSSVTSTITTSADLAVAKSGPATVVAGTNITYALSLTNNGPSDAVNVSLVDTLPANANFVSLTPVSGPALTCTTPAVGATGTVTCTTASLAAGTTSTLTLIASVPAAVTGSLQNTLTATSATADPVDANNAAAVTTTVTPQADLSVTKSGPPMTDAGSTAQYSITVANGGPSNATSVTLTDTLPANTTFASLVQTSGTAFTCTTPAAGAPGTISCTAPSLAPAGTAVFTLIVNVTSAAATSVTNTATVSSATTDPAPGNNSASATTPVGTAADLSLTKSGSTSVAAGANLTYQLTLSNAGPADALNVTLTDTLPVDTTFVSFAQTGGPVFSCTTPAAGAAGTVTCSIASFANAATATFTLVVRVSPTAAGPISNTASVSSATGDPTPGNSFSTAAAAVTPGSTDLSIQKSASATAAVPNSNVTYTLVATNNGPATAFGVTVTDVLPAGVTLLSASATQGTCSGTTTVVCNVDTLAPGASATITLLVRLPQGQAPVANTATISATNADPDAANNSSSATINVTASAEIPTLSPVALALLALGALAVALRRMG